MTDKEKKIIHKEAKISTVIIYTTGSERQWRKMLPQGIPFLATSTLNDSL